MNDQQRRRQERGTRVRDFAAANSAAFANGKAAQTSTRIAQLVTQTETLGAAHETNARTVRAGVSGKREARDALRNLLRAIARTARAISLDDPALKDTFRLPANNPSNQLLLDTARSFHTEAAARKDQFIEYGMSANFLADLQTKIDDFERHANEQHTGTSARAATRAGIGAALDELDDEIARFDTIVRNKFAADPAMLAAWETARRLERAPQKRKATQPVAPAK